MAAPNTREIEPTIFFARGYTPDVRLHVLDQEVYHVHSVILKLHSNFFFKFLDSPDKVASRPAAGDFKHEWVTKVDEDGTWSLVAATGRQIKSQGMEKFKGDLEVQSLAFGGLISAMYGKECRVYNISQLSILTQLAEYYCALPVVSKTLSRALHSGFCWDFLKDAVALFGIALKFRHRALLTDPVLHLAGRRWNFSTLWVNDIPDGEPTLLEMVKLASFRVDSLVASALSALLHSTESNYELKQELTHITGFSSMPEYFRKLQDWNWSSNGTSFLVQVAIHEILAKNVNFNLDNLPRVGEEELTDTFLCGWIAEKDIPWDTTQEDW